MKKLTNKQISAILEHEAKVIDYLAHDLNREHKITKKDWDLYELAVNRITRAFYYANR